ncbi:MAG: ATP synthase subunit I [Oscillospiraceae bacterium]|nr:ATP synthase subunit I [Oscillospiraceae bacterium]
MAKISPAVRKETLHIAEGTGILTAVMLAVFALLGRFDLPVLWGSLMGGAVAILNFFLLGLTVQRATQEEDQARMKMRMQFSYSVRMLLMLVVCFVGFRLSMFNGVAVLLEMLFPRITIFFLGLKNSRSGGKEENP